MITSEKGKEFKILAVVPARGGSKGIPKKNIRPLNGRPLLYYTAEFIKQLPFIDEAIVSSDCSKIIEIAKSYGLKAPFIRPKNISGDNIHDIKVLKHSLLNCESYFKCKFDIVIMLQPTSPIRKKKMFVDALKKLVNNDFDSIWSISKVDLKYNPKKQLIIVNKENLKYFSSKAKKIINRQMLEETYIRTGQLYAIRRTLIVRGTMLNDKSGFVIENGYYSNIDSNIDLKETEQFMKKKMKVELRK